MVLRKHYGLISSGQLTPTTGTFGFAMNHGTTTTTDCCPECGSDVDWGLSSWCPSCGFYPAINFRNEQGSPDQDEAIDDHWWEVVPTWLWVLLAGICLIVAVSGCYLVLSVASEIRSGWSLGATSDDTATGDHHPTNAPSAPGTVADSVPESIRRDSLPPTQPHRTEGSPEAHREVECLILGYTTNTTGEIRSLLLAAAPDFRFLRFVCKLPVDQVAPDVLEELLQKSRQIPATKPMVRCPYGGRWVQPELFCIATYEGWSAEGRLNNAEVVRLIDTQTE